MKRVLSIDFGTTNSVVAAWDADLGQAEFISLPGLSTLATATRPPLAPSLLYVQDGRSGQAVLGQAVPAQGLDRQHDNRFFRSFKRGILAATAATPRLIDGVPWSDSDAGRRFLRGLLDALPFAADEIEQLIVTAPVAAFDGYLAWLSDGLRHLAAEQVRLVDESTAAALGYAITEPGATLLVFDFGGGSLDLSLVQLPQAGAQTGGWLEGLRGKSTRAHTARVIAKAGANLGGSDVDAWLLDKALALLNHSAGDLGENRPGLLAACEAAKVALSFEQSTLLALDLPGGPQHLPFSRSELVVLLETRGFFSSIERLLDRVMHLAQRQGIFAEDIRYVLMVGGSSLMPSVQDLLRGYFKHGHIRVDKPFTAIAEGALALAAGFGLDDYLLHSYGLRVFDARCGEFTFDEIIPMGSRYPSEKPVEVLLCAAHDGQTQLDFVVGEADNESVAAIEMHYEDGQPVFTARAQADAGQAVLLNAAYPTQVPLDPPGQAGVARIRARFSVDAQRQLHINIYDLHTRRELLADGVAARLQEQTVAAAAPAAGNEPALPPDKPAGVQRRLSLRGLGTLLNLLPPDAISLEAAAAALCSDEFYIRFAAAEILSRRGDREARRILQDVLSSGTPPQRASVAHHLHRFSWFSAEAMLRQALADPDLRVQESAVYSLCMLRGPDAYALLLQALQRGDDRLRLAAAWGMSKAPDAAGVPVLAEVLRSADAETRVRALESLGETGAPAALPVVCSALEDNSLEVRYAAALSWVELAGEACLPDLARRIRSGDSALRAVYTRALFHATNYLFIDVASGPAALDIIAALEAACADPDSAARLAAGMALAWIHHPRTTDLLQATYEREPEPEIQARLLMHAIHLSSPAGRTIFRQARRSPHELVRQTAEYLSRTYAQTIPDLFL